MKRRIYVIAQRYTGKRTQVIGNGDGTITVFAEREGKLLVQKRIKRLNKDLSKIPVFLRDAWIEF